MKPTFSHINEEGQLNMVDVSGKEITHRTATAGCKVVFPENVFEILKESGFAGKKGSIIQTAVIAGIQAAKRTSDLIPLCHPLAISKIGVDIVPEADHSLRIECTVSCEGKTGVEMEALTGASISALTVYDMCKALSHDIKIAELQLQQKSGGKNDFNR